MQTTSNVQVGQVWRDTDGHRVTVVGYAANGWPWVRLPQQRAPGSGYAVNPAWFKEWALVGEA